jgi:hypothetical protein
MEDLIRKLNYKGFSRIVILNSEAGFFNSIAEALPEVVCDREVDQRCPYMFIIVFVNSVSEVEHFAPLALHNLTADGVLWFCYPKKSSKKYKSDLNRDEGWQVLNDAGFHGIRMVAVDSDWSALRFRNIKYIKSESGRFNK